MLEFTQLYALLADLYTFIIHPILLCASRNAQPGSGDTVKSNPAPHGIDDCQIAVRASVSALHHGVTAGVRYEGRVVRHAPAAAGRCGPRVQSTVAQAVGIAVGPIVHKHV